MKRSWILVIAMGMFAACGDVSSKAECQAQERGVCGGPTLFCDHNGRCQSCAPGLLNCDGVDHCEKQGNCYAPHDGGGGIE